MVVPLSDKQKAALAKGRAALAAKAGGEPPAQRPAAPAPRRTAGRGSVEVVTVSKATRSRTKATGGTAATRRTKASGSRSRRSQALPPKVPAASVSKESPGPLERLVRWLAST